MRNFIRKIVSDEQGTSVLEYGLLIALFALVAMTAGRTLGANLSSVVNAVAGSI